LRGLLRDDIVAALLIPDDVLHRTVSAGPITAQHPLTFHKAEASQVVCAIALASSLTSASALC
jgi:hypothetical protein